MIRAVGFDNFSGSIVMKRFAILVVAVFAVALMESQSEAQFYGGRGFGGLSLIHI